ncbi:MAG: HAMP domain-containing protein [Anaeromyxobacter sp.]|nr:HAMP domain-containing protein [Anaeromyxobacter sp.]MBL0278202.1 HAMP domain-containing protein [Anaeromyxobacter sp.]
MTLRLKLFILIAGAIFFATTGVTAVALWREVIRGQELLAREGVALASTAASAASHWLQPGGVVAPGGEEALPVVLRRLMDSAPLDRAWVVDRAGRVLACQSRTDEGCPEGVQPSEFLSADWPLQALKRLIQPEGIVASAPVLHAGEVVGAVRVDFAHEEVVGSARDLALGASLVGAFWIAMGLGMAVIFISSVTKPLLRLVDAAGNLAEERGVQLEVPEDRETADLVRAFNHMSTRLEERRAENQRLISELERRVEEKTREVLKADRLATLGGIAAGFAHEIGNSLNVIRGYAAVAERELPEAHPNRPDVHAIRRETARAAELLERFLVFARARASQAFAQPVEPVLREAVEVVGPAAAQAKVERVLELAEGLPWVVIDAGLLRQAFLNLCVNAVQAMTPGGGRLTASARHEGGQVVVELRDTGPGLPPDAAKRIFEPFFTTKAEGTGLGLAIVRQAAEAHGGTVEVESAPGQGATFRLRLPVARAQDLEQAGPAGDGEAT